MESFAKPSHYEIRIRGRLSETLLAGFPGLDARAIDGDTALAGALIDQAALHGVLNQVEALGLELLEVRRDPSPGDLTSEINGAARLHTPVDKA